MIFAANDGTPLYCQSSLKKNARGSILIVHGLGEHGGRYEQFCKEMQEKLPLNVHSLDLRGHGRSLGLRGHVEEFSTYQDDIDCWLEFLKKQQMTTSAEPIFFFGHSLGDLILLNYFSKKRKSHHNIVGLILSSPAIAPIIPMGSLKYEFAKKMPAFLKQLYIPNGIDPHDLSQDRKAVEKYKNDPLVHNRVTPAFFCALMETVQSVQETKISLQIPVLFMLAGSDKVVDSEKAKTVAESISAPLKELKILRGFFHEIFQEKRKQDAYSVLKDWVKRTFEGRAQWQSKKVKSKNSSKLSKNVVTAKATSRSRREKRAASTLI